MTRTVRTYSNSSAEDREPRYFAKSGHAENGPNAVKKNGHGRCNWGTLGDEVDDLELSGEFNFANPRRRSNSVSRTTPAKDIRPPAYESTEAEKAFDEEEEIRREARHQLENQK